MASSALVTEAHAVRKACKLAVEQRYDRVVIESDSKQLIDSLHRGCGDCLREIAPIQQDIRNYAILVPSIEFHAVSRDQNKAAHCLAAHAKKKFCPLSGDGCCTKSLDGYH